MIQLLVEPYHPWIIIVRYFYSGECIRRGQYFSCDFLNCVSGQYYNIIVKRAQSIVFAVVGISPVNIKYRSGRRILPCGKPSDTGWKKKELLLVLL